MLLLPSIALKSLTLFLDWHLPHWVYSSLFGISSAAFLLFHLRFEPAHRSGLQRLQRRANQCLSVVAACGTLFLIQLAWFGWRAHNLNAPQHCHRIAKSSLASKSGHPRIIWIVLDELSYQQVYGHRFRTLSLPTFDQLARQSTVFTHVVPAGIATEIVLPSLMLGQPLDQIHPSPDGYSLATHNPLTKRWQTFDPQNTVFGDALDAGYSNAVAGWYNPYCRILPQVLDECYWAFHTQAPNKMLPQASMARNVIAPLLLTSSVMNHLPSFLTHDTRAEDLEAELHIASDRQITEAADRLLQNASLDFTLIHMPFPHPGGIYNRTQHSLTTRNSDYLDNLALADAYLAHVCALLEANGQWDSSAVVIMGDHSWRTQLVWANRPGWTAEEQEASNGGQFDDRPAYIVKLPNQKDGSTINTPFAAVDTRTLLQAIMKKQIRSPQDLSAWAETSRQ